MKKNFGLIILVVIFIIAIVIGGWGIGTYNSLVSLQEEVRTKSSDVNTYLERRADLIPNLVSTVKGYMSHEKEVIENITDARTNLLYADDMDEKAIANNELSRAIDALMVVVENYPDLKASTNFINLQDELSGTENRIAVARKDYNEAVKNYNTKIRKAPANIIAEIFDFDDEDYFAVSEGKADVPDIDF